MSPNASFAYKPRENLAAFLFYRMMTTYSLNALILHDLCKIVAPPAGSRYNAFIEKNRLNDKWR